MREILKKDGSKMITMNDEPKVNRLKEADLITTHNIEEVKRRRAEEAAKAEADKGGSK